MSARRCPAWCTDHLEHLGSADGAVEHRGDSLTVQAEDLQTPFVARVVQEVNDHGSEEPHVQLHVPRTAGGQVEVSLDAAEALAIHLLAAIETVRGRASEAS